jgi:multidrug efflux pump subunit AcrB
VTADDVINRLRGKLAVVPGATLFLQSAQDLTIGGSFGNAQYQFTLQRGGFERPEQLGAASTVRKNARPAGTCAIRIPTSRIKDCKPNW